MRISDWSSDVCSSDLDRRTRTRRVAIGEPRTARTVEIVGGGGIVHEARPSIPVRFERSRDAPRPCTIARGVSTSLDTNGDRKSVVEGKRVSGRVDLGGRRIIQKKHSHKKQRI